MYIRENELRRILTRSKVLSVFGWITTILFGSCFAATFLKKVEMQFAVATFFGGFTFVGLFLLWLSNWYRKVALDAKFLENVFANDLDGTVEGSEISEVMGKSENRVIRRLKRLKSLCMKGYTVQSDGERFFAELESKKTKCICKNCGGEIEKKIYFKGLCPYCGSLDIFAQVITEDKLYSIGRAGNASSESYYYLTGDADVAMQNKETFKFLIHALVMILCVICTFLSISDVRRGDAKVTVPIFFVIFSGVFLANMLQHYWNFVYIATARRFSKVAAKITAPLVSLQELYVEGLQNNYYIFGGNSKECPDKKKLKVFREIQRRGYARNCSLILLDDGLMIGLKREIKQDTCPMCGSPLTGTLKDRCQCNYCGYIIENAIEKA